MTCSIVGVARREQAHDLGFVQPRARHGAFDDDRSTARIDARSSTRRARLGGTVECPAPSRRRAPSPRRRSCGARAWRRPARSQRSGVAAHRPDRPAGAAPAPCPSRRCARASVVDLPATAPRGSRDRASPATRRPSRSMPAPISCSIDAGRQVGRRLDVHRPARGSAAPRRWSTAGRRGPAPAASARLVSGLARKFWTMTSWMWPCCACRSRIASSAFEPLRARLADADQDAGGERHRQLAGEPHRLQPHRRRACRASRNARRPARTAARWSISSMMPWLADTSRSAAISSRVMTPGLTCGSRPVSLQHQRAHRAQVVDRGRVAERRQRLARRAVAQLRLVAQGEQRLGAACRGAGAGDGQHLPRATGRPAAPRAAARRRCSSGRRRGTAGSAG